MIAKTPCENATSVRFHQKLEPYLHHFGGEGSIIRVHKKRGCGTISLGEAVAIPNSDLHHVLDSEAMLALSHAIEDIAAEVSEGELIATFQDFKNFLPQKNRYMQLAENLDAVRVWGEGDVPKNCGKIDFVATDLDKIRRYWMVLLDSEATRAVLLCKQLNSTTSFPKKKFVGFYSFNPYLVQSIRWRFNLLSCGLSRVMSHCEKTFQLPDLKMSDLEKYLKQPDEE